MPTVAAPAAPTVDLADLADRVKPAVVNITVEQGAPAPASAGQNPFEFFFGLPESWLDQGGPERDGEPRDRRTPARTGMGSGFIIDPSGLVVTNEHVVAGATSVKVKLADERELTAKVVGRDPKLDVALLRIEGGGTFPSVTLGSSAGLRVGETVVAIGNPFGLGHTVTSGIVSAKARTLGLGPYDDFIQTDASINPGNSGGPLFDLRGNVVAIAAAIRPGANGIGFAIPIDALKEVLPQLQTKGFVERGRLGLAFQPVTQALAAALGLGAPRGALVAEVEAGGPAHAAGIRSGDVIVRVGDSDVTRSDALARTVARHAPGAKLRVTVLREGKERTFDVTLGKMEDKPVSKPQSSPSPSRPRNHEQRLGLDLEERSGGGLVVRGIAKDADAGDLRPGDVIVEIDGKPVRDMQALRSIVSRAPEGDTMLVKVERGERHAFVALRVRTRPAS